VFAEKPGSEEELASFNDLATVSGLSEQLLNQALQLRYDRDRIYVRLCLSCRAFGDSVK
jgi:myosin heavy subunit